MPYMGIGFLLFGIVFAAIGIAVRVSSARADARRRARAMARICDVRRERIRTSQGRAGGSHHSYSTDYYPVLQFVDAEGTQWFAEQSVSNNDDYEIGEIVEVAYDPRDPAGSAIMVRDMGVTKVIFIVFVAVGCLCCALGTVVLVLAARGIGA